MHGEAAVDAVVDALEVVVEPGAGVRPDVVRQADQAGGLGGGVVAGAQLQALGAGEALVEGGELVRREDRVAPGVGEHHGGAVGVDAVDVGGGGAPGGPGADGGLVRVVAAEEASQGGLQLVAGMARQVARDAEQRGRLEVLGLVAEEGAGEVGPAAERGHGADARVEGGAEQADADAVRDARGADAPRVGGGAGEGPVDDAGEVGDVLRAGDLDLAAGSPEAARGVRDDDVALLGEAVGLREVFEVVEAPAGGQHEQRVPGGAVAGFVDVALEDDAAVAGDVGEAQRGAGGLGGGARGELGQGDRGGGEQGGGQGERGGAPAGACGHGALQGSGPRGGCTGR